MKPPADEVRRELERLRLAGFLSPQERALLEHLVEATLQGNTGLLYQKALATTLGITSAKQIGVVATRVRTKLAAHYATSPAAAIQIALSDRGYEVRFSYRPGRFPLGDRAQLLVANAKAAIDQRTLPGAAAALKFLDGALAAEPDHPLILAQQAYCHATRALYGTYPRHDLDKAQALVERTRLATGSRPWQSWFAEACVEMALHWNWRAADAAFTQAIASSGGEARSQPWYTAFLASQGRAAEAVPLLRAAVARSHDSPIVRVDLASAQISAGQLDEAQETIDTSLTLFGERSHYLLFVHQAILHEARGSAAEALATIERLPLTWPRTAVTLGLRALFSGLSGDRRTARRHFAKLRAARRLAGRFVPAGQLSIAALGANDVAAAVDWLRESAVVERDPNLVLANVYPFFRHLHQDDRFRALVVDTMNLSLPPTDRGTLLAAGS